MTTRTLAATAAALPHDILDRRTMLASAGAAAVLAAISAPAMAEVHPDAALLALRATYEQTLALMDHFSPAHSRAEDAYFSLKAAEPKSAERDLRKRSGLTLAERDYNRATNANLKVIERIAETPARTTAGVTFKAEVSRREGDTDLELLASIVTDLLALGSTQATTRI